MSQSEYHTAPVETEGMPRGIPFIIGNETAERFSYYGMRAVLVTFMTKFLVDSTGGSAPMSEPEARGYYSLFVSSAYFFPLFGALLADIAWGKYRTILWLSIVYCLGHLALALDDSRIGLFFGLGLIAIGAGGIKPCVSAHVGDQFGRSNSHLLEKVFGWFYLAINLGAFLSTLITPWLLNSAPGWLAEHYPNLVPRAPDQLARLGPHLAFGLPGLLMVLATFVFWLGRHVFVHIPPPGGERVGRSLTGEGLSALLRLVPLYAFVAVFWSIYDQTGSAWVLQAEKLDRHFLGSELHPEQIQAINPFLILVFVPLFSYVVYPLLGSLFEVTPLRKVGAGLFLNAIAFGMSAVIEQAIQRGATPSMYWQILAFAVLTAGEVLVSVTCLEYSYTQSPPEVKSFVMALYLLSVSAGNLLTYFVNMAIMLPEGGSRLSGAEYYWFFTGLMLLAALLYLPVSLLFRSRSYIAGSDAIEPALED